MVSMASLFLVLEDSYPQMNLMYLIHKYDICFMRRASERRIGMLLLKKGTMVGYATS